jgi:outer membrane receptor protein involved in Fe transport
VVAEASGRPLPGATVRLVGTARGTAADGVGRFVLRGVAPGEVTLAASFVGFVAEEQTVTVRAGASVTVDFALAEDATQLNEIVVRSEKFTRDLQATQSSVNVVDAAQVEALAVRDWRDASRLVGNFAPTAFGGFVIRGVNSTGVGSGGTGTTAQLYVDGVAQNATTVRTGMRGLWDVEAVEVFRGPQSTVAGRNALAGAVAIRTKDPVFTWDAAARVRGGNQSTREAALMLNAPLVDDQLALRVSGEYQFLDPGFDYARLDTLGFDDFDQSVNNAYGDVRARLLVTPTALPGFSARLGYTYAYDRPNLNQDATLPADADPQLLAGCAPGAVGTPDAPPCDQGALEAAFAGRTSNQVVAPREWNHVHNTSLEMSYDATDALTLTSISGFLVSNRYFDTLTYQAPDVVTPVSNKQDRTTTDFTQELRLNVNAARTTAVVGGYLGTFHTDTDRTDRGDIFPIVRPLLEAQVGPLPPFEILYEAEVPFTSRNTNLAAFGEVNYAAVPDRLTLTAGLRYDRESVDNRTALDATVSAPNSPLPAPTTEALLDAVRSQISETEGAPSQTFDALLPKAGVTVDLTPDASLGATVQRGYRAGGAQVLSNGETNTFDPEFTWNYEVAFRSQWLGRRLTVNANAFYTDWRDQQLLDRVEGTTLNRTVNAGASTLYGAELEVRAVPAAYLTTFASLGLVQAEFDRFVLLEGTDEARDLAGYGFPNAPGETVAVGVSYAPPTGFFGAASASYTGAYYSDLDVLPPQDAPGDEPLFEAGGYTVVDARVGYTTRLQGVQTSVALFGRNLFNEDVFLQTNFDPTNTPVARLGLPRVVGVSLQAQL